MHFISQIKLYRATFSKEPALLAALNKETYQKFYCQNVKWPFQGEF
jgi:hypothetical protein